jgi:uncharacterized protein (DUF2164 family)
MEIKLNKDVDSRLIGSLQRYLAEELDTDASQLQAQLLLDFIKQEIGPYIYNRAVSDAQQMLQQQVEELNLHCYALETSHWGKK